MFSGGEKQLLPLEILPKAISYPWDVAGQYRYMRVVLGRHH
jgi:hypothetical protein